MIRPMVARRRLRLHVLTLLTASCFGLAACGESPSEPAEPMPENTEVTPMPTRGGSSTPQ